MGPYLPIIKRGESLNNQSLALLMPNYRSTAVIITAGQLMSCVENSEPEADEKKTFFLSTIKEIAGTRNYSFTNK
jgi:hypothetical protein